MVKKSKRRSGHHDVAAGDSFSNSPIHSSNSSQLEFINRQRTRRLNVSLLRQIIGSTLTELLRANQWDLTFYFVGAKRMAEINETHLNHQGPTDVITFDYGEDGTRNTQHVLHGEIFICVDVAISQAREFRTTWQSEVVRYMVHALLHLCGYDDLKPAARRKMKLAEDRLVRKLARQFKFAAVGRQ